MVTIYVKGKEALWSEIGSYASANNVSIGNFLLEAAREKIERIKGASGLLNEGPCSFGTGFTAEPDSSNRVKGDDGEECDD